MSAQEFVYTISLESKIIDRLTKEPIEFVNVGFLNKGIGTVTDIKGAFSLEFQEASVTDDDIFLISNVGYYPIKLSYGELKEVLGRTKVIKLTPTKIDKETTAIAAGSGHRKYLGTIGNSRGIESQWQGDIYPGSEIATMIENNQGKAKIEDISFFINANLSDSIYPRFNLYSVQKGRPGQNLLKQNIVRNIKIKRGVYRIDISDKNIVVEDDFAVGLELLKAFGNQVYFSTAETDIGTPGFTRPISQVE